MAAAGTKHRAHRMSALWRLTRSLAGSRPGRRPQKLNQPNPYPLLADDRAGSPAVSVGASGFGNSRPRGFRADIRGCQTKAARRPFSASMTPSLCYRVQSPDRCPGRRESATCPLRLSRISGRRRSYSYGTNLISHFRHAAKYIEKILKGAKPADLAHRAADEARAGDQHEDRQGARPHHSTHVAGRRGRDNRVSRGIPYPHVAASAHSRLLASGRPPSFQHQPGRLFRVQPKHVVRRAAAAGVDPTETLASQQHLRWQVLLALGSASFLPAPSPTASDISSIFSI